MEDNRTKREKQNRFEFIPEIGTQKASFAQFINSILSFPSDCIIFHPDPTALYNMNPFSYNGGVCVAMKGDKCVAIASDHRLGAGRLTVGTDFPKVFEMGPALYLGLPGLTSDSLTVVNKLKFRVNLYELSENRKIKPHSFKAMLEHFLYEKRFGGYFIAPVIAGLDPDTDEPFVTAMDMLGAGETNEPFAVAGTAEESLLGLCEALWEPNLKPDDLFETISQVILNAVDFDCLAGAGATVHVIEKDKVTTRTIKTRMD